MTDSLSNPQFEKLLALFNSGQVDEVIRLLPATSGFKDNSLLQNFFGVAHASKGNLEFARTGFENAIKLDPNNSEALGNLGGLYLNLGLLSDAKKYLELSIKKNPANANAHFNLGNIYQRTGEREFAEANYEKAFLADNNQADACLQLCSIRKWSEHDPLINRITNLYTQTDRPIAWRARISLSLASIYFNLEKPAEAMRFLNEGNRLRKLELPYDLDQDRKLFNQILERFKTHDVPAVADIPGTDCQIPIFIVGMPRSGTTLLEQIMDCHSLIEGRGELPYLKQAIVKAEKQGLGLAPSAMNLIRNIYLKNAGTNGRQYFVDKMPLNFRWIGYIVKAIPESRIIHITRGAEATCWSNYRTFFANGGNRFSNDQVDVAEYFGLYRRLMRGWNELFPDRIVKVNYEGLVSDTGNELQKLFARLQIPFEQECLNHSESKREVATASALQVRQPIYTNSSENWKKFSPFLSPMLGILSQIED